MKRIVWFLAVGMLAAVFVVAGVIKLQNPAAFADQIRNYRLLPWPACVALALYLPGLEVISGLALLWRRTRKGALLIVMAMLLAFLGALLSAWARGLNIDCGCFGEAGPERSIPWALLEDLLFLTICAWLARHERA